MNCVFCAQRAEYEAWILCDEEDGGGHRLVCGDHLKDAAMLLCLDGAPHTEYLHYWHIALRPLGE